MLHAPLPSHPDDIAHLPSHGLLKLALHEMARLYRPYNGVADAKSIRTTIGPSHVTFAIVHRVADLSQVILWQLPKDPLPAGNTLPLQIAFQAPPGTVQTWHHATLHLQGTITLLD